MPANSDTSNTKMDSPSCPESLVDTELMADISLTEDASSGT